MGFEQRYTGCQLEAGPVATPFEQRPYGLELLLCQRYYYKLPAGALVCMYSPSPNATVESTTGLRWGQIVHPVTMRATPTTTADIAGATASIGIQSPYGSRVQAERQGDTKGLLVNLYTADAEL
jgi:hypothetical protein